MIGLHSAAPEDATKLELGHRGQAVVLPQTLSWSAPCVTCDRPGGHSSQRPGFILQPSCSPSSGVVSNEPCAQLTQERGAMQQRRCESENGQFVCLCVRSCTPPPHEAEQADHGFHSSTRHSMEWCLIAVPSAYFACGCSVRCVAASPDHSRPFVDVGPCGARAACVASRTVSAWSASLVPVCVDHCAGASLLDVAAAPSSAASSSMQRPRCLLVSRSAAPCRRSASLCPAERSNPPNPNHRTVFCLICPYAPSHPRSSNQCLMSGR